ncbi:type I DNA topoisomerase [uncultured Deinococcus sp.]|uniref:type I DNA topoisomerase n=1 Tax=uncultured Deinococcus sp. TaxID=158789 RepID=UPI00258E91FB|nr:type I DNA topoisomerase [uncultured Deinococcus sp.]
MPLLIVESPKKAKQIASYLGRDWTVKACFGHVRDLPAKKEEIPVKYRAQAWARLGVDVEGGYTPIYVERAKANVLAELRAAVKAAKGDVYLASDPDREGESIAWHLSVVLGLKDARRVTYQEVTKAAIQKALQSPRPINLALVAAQESRRILDRLAGYGVSPLLWDAIGGPQSAGRVQSAALMLLAQREQARMRFVPAGYWRVMAQVGTTPPFQATVQAIRGLPLATAASFTPQGQLKEGLEVAQLDVQKAEGLRGYLEGREAEVTGIEVSPVVRRPPPPFTTSSLQQAAGARLRFSVETTSWAAQSLYEQGLITYIRTDSPALSDEALDLARAAVQERFGPGALPPAPRQYATRNANAQEAHEAIRPAGDFKVPNTTGLSGDELALYTLIYTRTVVSQMQDALGEKTTVRLQAGVVTLGATGTRLTQRGFTALYEDETEDADDQALPALTVGQRVGLSGVKVEEKKSSAPPRYGEGAFVQLMEKAGIGRPSTYASTLKTLQGRSYVAVRGRKLHVTPLGLCVAMYLMQQLPQLVDARFTAEMERELDTIAQGRLKRTVYLDRVWREALQPAIARAQRTSPRLRVPGQEAVFEVQGGQVSLRTAQGVVTLPPELLPEDLNEQSIVALLAGMWKAGKVARAEGASEASRVDQPARAPQRKKGEAGMTNAPRKPRQKQTAGSRTRKSKPL